jgi:hypothetical protein
MSDEQTLQSADDTVAWDHIEPVAKQMFRVWMGNGEIEWAKECWQHFAANGLTGASTTLEATATHLRLLALVRVYEQFCGYAWEENPETPLSYLTENLKIDPLSLDILAGPTDSHSSEGDLDEDDLHEAALTAATDAMREEIYACLAQAYGGPVPLYSRMSKTNRSADLEDDGSEFNLTGHHASALQFVTDRFSA